MQITTNNVPRDVVYGFDLSEKERREFDYLEPEELDQWSFVRYRGEVYALSEFERARFGELEDWDGYKPDSFFSGLVLKWADDCAETVIVGRYCS